MKPHPDFDDLNMPEEHQLGRFSLTILTGADLEEDYKAVMSSASVLQGIFGPNWPVGLTKAEDEIDLHWHHREFTAKRSFAWVIRDQAKAYIGCAYLSPDMGTCGTGDAPFWMIDSPERKSRIDAFGPLYGEWLQGLLPKSYVLTVRSNEWIGENARH